MDLGGTPGEGGMKPGDLVKSKWGKVVIYGSLDEHNPKVGCLDEGDVGLVVDVGIDYFDPNKFTYYRVLTPSGVVGWGRADGLKRVR